MRVAVGTEDHAAIRIEAHHRAVGAALDAQIHPQILRAHDLLQDVHRADGDLVEAGILEVAAHGHVLDEGGGAETFVPLFRTEFPGFLFRRRFGKRSEVSRKRFPDGFPLFFPAGEGNDQAALLIDLAFQRVQFLNERVLLLVKMLQKVLHETIELHAGETLIFIRHAVRVGQNALHGGRVAALFEGVLHVDADLGEDLSQARGVVESRMAEDFRE